MLAIQHDKFDDQFYIVKDGHGEDFFILIEGIYIFIYTAYKKITSGFAVVSTALNHLTKAFFWLVLFPIRIISIFISVPIYLIIAPVFRVYFFNKAEKLKTIYLDMQSKIKVNSIAKDKLIKNHRITQDILDALSPRVQKLHGEIIMKPALDALLNELKNIELLERVSAYPERNEIVCTYDELLELAQLSRESSFSE